jgi:hypothetical protein
LGGLALLMLVGGYWLGTRTPAGPSVEKRPAASPSQAQFPVATVAHTSSDLPVVVPTQSLASQQAAAAAQLDPARDGWETEVIAELAKSQLTALAARITGVPRDRSAAPAVAPEVQSGPLRPAKLTELYRGGQGSAAVIVRQAANDARSGLTARGRDSLAEALDTLAEPLADAHDVHVHVKVIRVESTPETAATTAYFEAAGHVAEGTVQQRATWLCNWRRLADGGLELTSLEATDYEEVVTSSRWLVDCTAAVLGANRSFGEQLLYGLNHWLGRLERVHGMHVFARNGLALGDANGDGLEDVYVCQPGGLPNRLFVQQPDGTAVDRSQDAGVDWLEQTSAALFLDLDNDGDQDLVAATVAGLLVMENRGQGNFRLRTTLATRDTDTQSFSAADYDNDGDLDLYICIEFAKQLSLEHQTDVQFVYHDANDGAPNVLFRNDITSEKWQFTDVTRETGLDADNRRHSLACAWEDFDNDGDQDLYVANDYGQNCLYENQRGHFRNIAPQANAVDSASGMSVSWGDYNHDGWMDLYVANMFSSAGNRITRQEQFKADADPLLRNIYSRFAKGNTLLENDHHGRFVETGADAGVEMGRWAWSSVFADLNNDAWEDLLVANGYITTEDSGDL